MSIAALHDAEMLSYVFQLASLEGPHLKDREKQYQSYQLLSHNDQVHVIWETEDGWWRQNIDVGKHKDLQKLIDNPKVALIFGKEFRFNEPGGWYDPS